MLRDILYALRTFRQSPGFTAVVVVSIALAIAANATVFSIVNGLLLGNLPVSDPETLLSFNGGRSMSQPDYRDYRDQTKDVFDGISAHFPLAPASIGGGGEPERVWGQLVSGNYFSVVGVRPVIGRGIVPAEAEVKGRDSVVVLSYALWQRRFGGDRGIAGRHVILNGAKYTVVGVAPKGFRGTDRGILAEFWVPLTMVEQMVPDIANIGHEDITEKRNSNWLMLLGRLKPGVSREKALAAVNVVKRRIDDTYFKNDENRRRSAMTLEKAGGLIDGMSKQVVGLMAVLMVVVGLVLLIACANVANLLLARASARQKEIAVRLSIGAGRRRLIRQLLTESVLLAAFGAVAGFALAYLAATSITKVQLPLPLPIVFDFTPDLRVLLFTTALTVVTGVLFGLAPALRATRTDLVSALKEQVSALGRSRRFGMRNTLVVVQVALSLVLLTGAGLFLRSLQNASSIDLGMRPGNVLLMTVDPKTNSYSPERTRQFVAALRERVSALPGVQSVTFVDSLPLSLAGASFDFKAEGAKQDKSVGADVYNVGARFFETMGLPLLRGRDFNAQTDRDGIIVNGKLARDLFGAADPIGQRVSAQGSTYTVVGIAGNAKSRTLGEEQADCAYIFLEPKPENAMTFFGISIAVKTTGNPYQMMPAVRREIAALDPNLAIFNTDTMSDHIDKAMLLPRVCATLLGVFGATGLTLAAIGLYGVMSYSVRRRTREFGIRIALGARAGGVLKMVLRQGLLVAGTGLVIGLGIALALGRFTASLLYGVSGTDAVTFVVVPVVLLAVALIAITVPARRAARVEPLRALRYE